MNFHTKAAFAAVLALLLCSVATTTASASSDTLSRSMVQATAPNSESMQLLKKQAAAWQEELSAQPEFASWRGASLALESLGPGGHSWMATVKEAGSGRPVGYMIVHAQENGGYVLGEYGAGDSPLFHSAKLKAGIRKAKLSSMKSISKLYLSPAAAVWQLTDANGKHSYADAWSGEILPINDVQWKQAASIWTAATEKVDYALHNDSASNNSNKNHFAATTSISTSSPLPQLKQAVSLQGDDPLERLSWMLQPGLSKPTEQKLLTLLRSGKLLDYSAELYGDSVRLIGQAAGYHSWSDGRNYGAFVMAGSQGVRYWPLSDAAANGVFYPVRPSSPSI
ncbi:hypothetical protein [Paenibacillus herberti]|uniref:Uncharacterized protein n=1 Tax=Paenibacillus herberti TaxID=1619309 RepID=A0A229P444_9BACL|nr:hypothetical protein [Paenibacillus herberti]OXM16831.1 hypothetical protein CGZ75_09315 [Paenibacillus herberti]